MDKRLAPIVETVVGGAYLLGVDKTRGAYVCQNQL